MKNRRFGQLIGLTGLLIVATLSYFHFQDTPKEQAARQHLNDLLGQANADETPDAFGLPIAPPLNLSSPEQSPEQPPTPAPSSTPFPGPELLFGLPMPSTDIAIEETSQHYVLRVPLKKAEDSSSVKVEVTPHRIELSGKTGSEEEGESFSSSFMQTFTTSQEVLPDQVHRRTEQIDGKTELVITIPKKGNSAAPSLPDYAGINDEDFRYNQPQNPFVPPNVPANGADNNSSPLDTYMNRVF